MRFMIPFALLLTGAAQEAPPLSIAVFLSQWHAAQVVTDRGQKAAMFTRLAERLAPSVTRYKALLDADKAAGRRPRACPAKGSTADLDIAALAVELEALPAAQRTQSMDAPIFAKLDKRFPCPTA